jgi:hypothetical protein
VKKSTKFRPDYQVVRDGKWGQVYKPVRLLVLPNGGLVSLMHSFSDDTWLVFSLDATGIVARSKVYKMKSVSEAMFRELCGELTAPAKDALIDKIAGGNLSPNERGDAAVELARLQLTDDDQFDGIIAKAEHFVKSHTPAECEAHIRQACEAYDEQTKAAAAGEADDGV